MKYILALSAFLLFVAPISAQEAIPYDQMTYEQLKEVKQSNLSKADKKALKKAKKKAKKAERQRVKLEKKKAKAEAKRLKAEEKKRKKANKAILKQLSLYDNAHRDTQITKDDFEAYVRISGPKYYNKGPMNDYYKFGTAPTMFLRSFYYPETSKLLIQLYFIKQFSIDELNIEVIDASGGDAVKYATKHGYWKNFNRATLKGGKEREATRTDRYLESCFSTCYFKEEVAVEINLADFSRNLETGTNFEMKVANRKGDHFIARLPAAYIYGYLHKLSTVDSRLAELKDIAILGKKSIEGPLLRASTK